LEHLPPRQLHGASGGVRSRLTSARSAARPDDLVNSRQNPFISFHPAGVAVVGFVARQEIKELSKEIVGPQHQGSVGLGLLFEELTRCSLFNYLAQPHKPMYALIWLHVMPTLKIVHRRGADRAQNYLALIEHRELNDHPIEVVALHLASLQRHCKFSMLEEFHCATSIGRCQFGSDEQAIN